MKEYLPEVFTKFVDEFPDVAKAYEELGLQVHQSGPLDVKTRYLVKLGIATAEGSPGAVRAHTRRALDAGATVPELKHAVMLSMTTSGFPGVIAALRWVEEVVVARQER